MPSPFSSRGPSPPPAFSPSHRAGVSPSPMLTPGSILSSRVCIPTLQCRPLSSCQEALTSDFFLFHFCSQSPTVLQLHLQHSGAVGAEVFASVHVHQGPHDPPGSTAHTAHLGKDDCNDKNESSNVIVTATVRMRVGTYCDGEVDYKHDNVCEIKAFVGPRFWIGTLQEYDEQTRVKKLKFGTVYYYLWRHMKSLPYQHTSSSFTVKLSCLGVPSKVHKQTKWQQVLCMAHI